MATHEVIQMVEGSFHGNGKSGSVSMEKMIELLDDLTAKVSSRRSRRWITDRFLTQLVPRLNSQEITGLFAPPPFGGSLRVSPFCITDVGEWEKFRSIDMDKQANIIDSLTTSSAKRRGSVDLDKMAVLNAWHRIGCGTREALRRSFLTDLIEVYEACVRAFIEESGDEVVLSLKVQDPFHRLLLHGVCEFYNLVSVTESESKDRESPKITRIRRKKTGKAELPSLTLSHFLKLSKEGLW